MSATVYKSREFDIRVDTISGRRYLMIHDHELETFAYIWFPKGFQLVYMEDRDRLIFHYIGRGNRHLRTSIVIGKLSNYLFLFKTYRRLLRKVFAGHEYLYTEPLAFEHDKVFKSVDGLPPLVRQCKTSLKYHLYNPITKARDYICTDNAVDKVSLMEAASAALVLECDKYKINYKSISDTLSVERDEGAE